MQPEAVVQVMACYKCVLCCIFAPFRFFRPCSVRKVLEQPRKTYAFLNLFTDPVCTLSEAYSCSLLDAEGVAHLIPNIRLPDGKQSSLTCLSA